MFNPNFDMRDNFFVKIYKLMSRDKNIVILSNDMGAPKLDIIKKKFPNNFFNMGITEQNIISVAAGLASTGKKVIVYSISTFISLRALEQIKLDICVMNLPVIILTVGAGYSYAVDGPTHHAIDDISVINSLGNTKIFCPSEPNQLLDMVSYIFSQNGLKYVRLDRGKWPKLRNISKKNLNDGFRVLGANNDVCLISTGTMVHRALEVKKALNKINIDSTVIDIFRLKPLNQRVLGNKLSKFKFICIIEEHTINGGLSYILMTQTVNYLKKNTKINICSIRDEDIYTYGKREKIHNDLGLDTKSILNQIERILKK